MTVEYELERCTRHCAATGRELRPGEAFYTVLVSQGGALKRIDYAPEAWQGPPVEGVVGWWKACMPTPEQQRARMAPNEVLIDVFEELQQGTELDLTYIVALLLVRRRILRLDPETNDTELVLYCPRNESTYRVAVAEPHGPRAAEIQQHLSKLLFADAK